MEVLREERKPAAKTAMLNIKYPLPNFEVDQDDTTTEGHPAPEVTGLTSIDTATIIISISASIFFIFTVVLVVCVVRAKRRRSKKKLIVSKYDKIFTTLRRPSPFSVVNAQRQLNEPNEQRPAYSALELVTDRPQLQNMELLHYQHTGSNKTGPDRLTKYHSFESAESNVCPKPLKKSKSMACLVTTNVTEQEPNTDISFSLKYVSKLRQLRLKLHGVSNLPIKTYGYDIYAAVYLFPRNTDGMHSRSVRGTRMVQFEETFLFDDMTVAEVEKSTLRLVLNYKRKSRTNKEGFLGEMCMKCCEVDWSSEQPYMFDAVQLKTLVKNGSTSEKYLFEDLGALFVCIEFQSSANRMKVMVRKASNLPKSDKLIGRPAHYVIINLQKKHEVVKNHETRTQSGHNPIWNQPFLFDFGGNDVSDYCLDFIIMRGKIHTKDAVVGHVSIGGNTCKSGRTHWKEILSPRPLETAKWHPICPVFNFKENNAASTE